MQDPLLAAPGRRPLLQSKTTSTCAQSGAARRPLAPLVLATPPSTSKIPTLPIPWASQSQPWPAPHTPRLGPSSAASTPSAPSNPRSRAKCRPLLVDTIPTMPKPNPRETKATPSALFVTPRVGHPCPRRRPLGPLRPSVESRLSGAYCRPRADGCPRPPRAKALLHPRPSLPPRRVERLYPPFSATMKKGVQAMGVQVAGARKLKSKAEGRGTRRRRH